MWLRKKLSCLHPGPFVGVIIRGIYSLASASTPSFTASNKQQGDVSVLFVFTNFQDYHTRYVPICARNQVIEKIFD